ncbi:MAG TPA: twin-arginine translocation signal domain-containing protein [Acidimicrobiales bacterium]|nr:twin-arginine translocation signal domain-containing protein [Acidimicrobiales bacterium]
MSLAQGIGDFLLARTSRRGFLAKATVTATALTVAPTDLLLKPGTAYGSICECAPGSNCNCSSMCCDGYTQFCCTINNGVNACPPGTFAGGWWKADGSQYCAGARYYIDCQGECHGCGCGGGNFCPSCDNLTCECALGTCSNRHVGCTEFRYGQCHMEISCSGRIACRVVSCTPPWVLDSTCSTVAQVDESTANHYAPCQDGPTQNPPVRAVVSMAATPTGQGYWLADNYGGVYPYGDAPALGNLNGTHLNQPIVGMASTSTGKGYWLVASDGGIFTFGDAGFDGSAGSIRLNKPMVGMSADDRTGGYRTVASDGGIFDYDAPFYGSTGSMRLNRPVVGMAATPSDAGYWLVASDGGIFSFGDAGFHGSLGSVKLNKPIVAMASTRSGQGYWLVASDGGIFTFGDAGFFGSLGSTPPAHPVVGMAATPSGNGYWMTASDGSVYHFGDAQFYGQGM